MERFDDDLSRFAADGAPPLPIADVQSDVERDGARIWYAAHAVMDALSVEKAALVGWSDGATIALILAMTAAERIAGVFFFACDMDPHGVKQITELTPILERCLSRHQKDYARLSSTPDQFKGFVEAVSLMMSTQPNYSSRDFADIRVPVAVVHSEHDEFIRREHSENLARTISDAELIDLYAVSHFAPLQRPDQFNTAMLAFLCKVLPGKR